MNYDTEKSDLQLELSSKVKLSSNSSSKIIVLILLVKFLISDVMLLRK